MMMVSYFGDCIMWRELIVDDEENLRRHAARGAQAAVKAAKDRAQAFDDSRGGKEEALDRKLLRPPTRIKLMI
jgi:hypothetical protein